MMLMGAWVIAVVIGLVTPEPRKAALRAVWVQIVVTLLPALVLLATPGRELSIWLLAVGMIDLPICALLAWLTARLTTRRNHVTREGTGKGL